MESYRRHPVIMGLHFLFFVPFIPGIPPILMDSPLSHKVVYIGGIILVFSFIIYGNLKPVIYLLARGVSLTNHYPAFRSYNDLLGYQCLRKTIIVLHFRSGRPVRLFIKKVDRKTLIMELKYHGIEILP